VKREIDTHGQALLLQLRICDLCKKINAHDRMDNIELEKINLIKKR